MFFTVILIWFGVLFSNAIIYEMLKDDKPIVYTPVNEVTEGWRQLEAPF